MNIIVLTIAILLWIVGHVIGASLYYTVVFISEVKKEIKNMYKWCINNE
jgi:hypothetical protein